MGEVMKHCGSRSSFPGFKYSGDWRVQYQNPHWHIYLLSSGTLKIMNNIEMDVFLVGGGEGGTWFGAGGYGGSVDTEKAVSIAAGDYEVVVGAGGEALDRYDSYSDHHWFGGTSSIFGYTALGGASTYSFSNTNHQTIKRTQYYAISSSGTIYYGSNAGGYTCAGSSGYSSSSVLDDGIWRSTVTDGTLGTTYAFGETTYPRFAPGGGGGEFDNFSSGSNKYTYSTAKTTAHIGKGGGGYAGADSGIGFTISASSVVSYFRTGPSDGTPNTGAGGSGNSGRYAALNTNMYYGTKGGSGIIILRDAR